MSEIEQLVIEKVAKGQNTALDALLSIHMISTDVLDGLLQVACKNQNSQIVNTLIKWGAKFANGTYLESLYHAYKLQENPANMNHSTLLKHAQGFMHYAIYQYVHEQKKLYSKSNYHPAALTIFEFNPKTILRDACISGNIRDVKHLIETKQVEYKKLSIDPLCISAAYGHKEIVSYFMGQLKPNEIKAKLNAQLMHKQFGVVSMLLETMSPTDLNGNYELKANLAKHAADIRDAFKSLLHDLNGQPKPDARDRMLAIQKGENALSDIVKLHISQGMKRTK